MPPKESAPSIVAALWGVDIDPRCAQVASAAIALRARRHCKDLPLSKSNVVTARSLPGDAQELSAEVGSGIRHRSLVDRIGQILAAAPLLGPLLKVEVELDREIREAPFGESETLPLAEDAFDQVEAELLGDLQAIADRASSSVAQRLLAAEADDALRFVDAMRKRYDVVLMNPPFGEPIAETKSYLRGAYPWLPTKDSNILAAFVGRGVELCRRDGYVGALTSRAGMYLSTFEAWRRQVLLQNRLQAVADLGLGVMEQALVEAAAYTIGPGDPSADDQATFANMLKEADREGGLRAAIAADRAGSIDPRLSRVRLEDFDAIPGAPLAYWMHPSLRRLFTDLPRLEGHGGIARQGLATGDDFRFVRAYWEVDPGRIGRSTADLSEGARWVPFAKGGEYSPYWADIHLVVDFGDDGRLLRSSGGSRVQNTQYYFEGGLTWPLRTASGFSPRILPSGGIFGHKGPAVISAEPLLALAWLTSRPAAYLLGASQPAGDETSAGGASKSYEVGLVQNLPWPGAALDASAREGIVGHATEMAKRRRRQDLLDETTRGFVAPPLPSHGRSLSATALRRHKSANQAALDSIADSAAVEACFTEQIGLGVEAVQELDGALGFHPSAYPRDVALDDAEFARLFELPMEQLIEEIIGQRGGGRAVATMTFVADRRIEVLAHAFECHPSVVEDARERLGLLPPGGSRRTAEDLLSYLFGIAVGRWDARVALDPDKASGLSELFCPPALRPPGMLSDSEALSARDASSNYPLGIPPSRLLIDEVGHDWDVEGAVLAAAQVVLDSPEDSIEEALAAVGSRTLRDFLRRKFFKEHLSRYSKSRRKAPIYWQLTIPARKWGAWLYAPSFTRETLYAVVREAARRERLGSEAIARIERSRTDASEERSARKVAAELHAEQELREEVARFKAEVERIAELGWEPDLDDGILLCAAPLADLFPAWPKAKQAREELREGRHTWASVARWADRI